MSSAERIAQFDRTAPSVNKWYFSCHAASSARKAARIFFAVLLVGSVVAAGSLIYLNLAKSAFFYASIATSATSLVCLVLNCIQRRPASLDTAPRYRPTLDPACYDSKEVWDSELEKIPSSPYNRILEFFLAGGASVLPLEQLTRTSYKELNSGRCLFIWVPYEQAHYEKILAVSHFRNESSILGDYCQKPPATQYTKCKDPVTCKHKHKTLNQLFLEDGHGYTEMTVEESQYLLSKRKLPARIKRIIMGLELPTIEVNRKLYSPPVNPKLYSAPTHTIGCCTCF